MAKFVAKTHLSTSDTSRRTIALKRKRGRRKRRSTRTSKVKDSEGEKDECQKRSHCIVAITNLGVAYFRKIKEILFSLITY